jgi:hypothetical protein
MRNEAKVAFAIIRYNVRTYQSGGVIAVMAERSAADSALGQLERIQPSEDRQIGWRYFVETSDLKVGMNPDEATQLRQSRLELRESQASDQPSFTPGKIS